MNIFAQNQIKAMFSMGEPQVGTLKKKGVNAASTIPRKRRSGGSTAGSSAPAPETWTSPSAGSTLASIRKSAIAVDKGHSGNTTNAAANTATGMIYGDKLVWLLTPENFPKRVRIWNEVKASCPGSPRKEGRR